MGYAQLVIGPAGSGKVINETYICIFNYMLIFSIYSILHPNGGDNLHIF